MDTAGIMAGWVKPWILTNLIGSLSLATGPRAHESKRRGKTSFSLHRPVTVYINKTLERIKRTEMLLLLPKHAYILQKHNLKVAKNAISHSKWDSNPQPRDCLSIWTYIEVSRATKLIISFVKDGFKRVCLPIAPLELKLKKSPYFKIYESLTFAATKSS